LQEALGRARTVGTVLLACLKTPYTTALTVAFCCMIAAPPGRALCAAVTMRLLAPHCRRHPAQSDATMNYADRFSHTPFIGRASELAALSAGLDGAIGGQGRLVLVGGEPGIGKTRLAEEVATLARERGARVLWGRCFEGEGAPAFWPWLQILRALLHDMDRDELHAVRPDGAAVVAQLLPEMHDRMSEPSRMSAGPPPEGAPDPAQARFRQFDAITDLLVTAARDRPLALMLDDLHWADTPSLLLLQFLASAMRDAALLLVGGYRDSEVTRGHPLTRTLAELTREPHAQRILLGGLPEPDVARCIELTTGVAPSPPLALTVAQGTEGNPLFVIEIARLLAAEGRLQPEAPVTSAVSPDGPAPVATVALPEAGGRLLIPPSVREVIGRRLDRLSPDCERMLTVAAVIGREFDVAMVARVGELGGGPILELLEQAEAARVVTPIADVPGRYRFAHAIIRETLYDELPSARRIRLHHQVGETLASLWQADVDAHAAELTHHFVQAVPSAGIDRAVTFARRAGDRALRLLAYEDAARHYQTALRVQAAGEPVDDVLRCELLLALGEAQTRSGDFAPARETLREAATLARSLGKAELLAHAAVSIAAGVRMGRLDPGLIGLMEEAVDAVATEDSALRVQVLAGLATALVWSGGDSGSQAELAEAAVAIARRVGDPGTLARALAAWCLAVWRPDNVNERLAAATEILPLARQADDPDLVLHSHAWRTICLLELGDLAAADAAIAAFTPVGEELRQPRYQWATPVRRAMRALLDGRFAEVEPLAQQALAIGQRAQHSDAMTAYFVQMFALRREQGRLAELESVAQSVVAGSPATPAWRAALALLYVELDRTEEARHEFESLAADDFASVPFDGNWLSITCLLTDVCAALGDERRAATLYTMLLPYAGRCMVAGWAAACGGAVSRYLGRLAATLHDWPTAAQHFEDALSLHERMGARPWIARTAYDYAGALIEELRDQRALTTGGSDQHSPHARSLLQRAHVTASELGMARLLRQVVARQAELKAFDVSARSPVDTRSSSLPDGLTAREVEVLRLLATGAINREIADALALSVRTVERHQLHIYAKIGARRRADAVAYALRHGLG
jgi:DNA-binding CsgD family transcriptional regulator/tetratricopeptide (TPR) repeat protein